MENPFVDVPLHLDERGTDESLLRDRIAFVVDSDADDRVGTLKSVTIPAGVAIPPASHLFGRGIQALFRNYLAGRDLRAGIAALADDQTFLRSVRRLTDRVYSCALTTFGAEQIVDASPTNVRVAEVIKAVYPDAAILRSERDLEAFAAVRPGPQPPPRTYAAWGETDPAPIFVVGVPRSGTTWLENMLLAHPGIAGPGTETSIMVSLRALRDNVRRPPTEGLAGWIDESQLVTGMHYFVKSLFDHWLAQHGHTGARFLEKTPMHAEHLRLIVDTFPDAAIISIHRDGRDVVHSVLQMEAAIDDAALAATRWAEITRDVAAVVADLPEAIDLRYESMLEDPVAAVRDVLEGLRLRPDETTLEEIGRRAGERVSQYNTTGEVGAGKWTALSAADLRAVHRHAGDRLVELGYMSADELARARRGLRYRFRWPQ